MSGPVVLTPLAQATDRRRFGSKVASLARAIAAGIAVPDGVALSMDHARAVEQGKRIPHWGGGAFSTFAVRSSGSAEDGAVASFAGQHLTKLGVLRVSLPSAVAAVVRSADLQVARAYRQRMEIPPSDSPTMAVLIQRMVAADVAGVLFTRHPIDKRDVRCVEANWGLGESVVSGMVTPDQYQFARGGTDLDFTVGDKNVAVVLGGDGATRQHKLSQERSGVPCLTGEHIRRLDDLAQRSEALAGTPVDIEWAFEGQQLWLLQVRPITV